MRNWAIAIYMLATHLKGVSSLQLERYLGVTQRTSWYMLHRLREAFSEPDELLVGVVEVDETWVGGKQKNRHARERRRHSSADAYGKVPVIGAVERGSGRVTAEPILKNDINTLTRFVERTVKFGSTVCTDDDGGYNDLMESYRHRTVNHSRHQYVKGDAHTNTIESVWAILKRSYKGTWHWISRKHMHRYVNETAGRWGLRDKPVIERMATIFRRLDGKRLRYADLVGR